MDKIKGMSQEEYFNPSYRGGGWISVQERAQVAFTVPVLILPVMQSSFLGARLIRLVRPLQQLGDVNNGLLRQIRHSG